MNYKNELESPLLGGDLGVGKSVIREIFTEILRPLSSWKRGKVPTPNSSQDLSSIPVGEGNNLCHYKTCPREDGDMWI